ncbi:type III-A CRISPR-associated RAMP protein Csm4 [Avibacterium paragallinarum]|uniref:type III-A CRISPR-associated RAMP protein Csm4 n=1 Tax=Avibacterium TaxID=292486 RepID=UPI002EDA0675
MKTYRFTLRPMSAFGTPLMGDTLFGQLCWAIVHRFSSEKLTALLQGYDSQKPFMVVSNAMPAGYIPMPVLPSGLWYQKLDADRKKLKKLAWIKADSIASQAVNQWQGIAFHQQEKQVISSGIEYEQLHNSINRQTQTTGEDAFAPFATSQVRYENGTEFDLYIVLDEQRFSLSDLQLVLQDIGQFGYGRDASTGLGKFILTDQPQQVDFSNSKANAYLTLANTAPQNLGLDKSRCFYQLTTRFGRHGSLAALDENPFKKPIILAKAGAIFTPEQWIDRSFLGNGLTSVSFSQTNAVHQGYAPVISVELDFTDKE